MITSMQNRLVKEVAALLANRKDRQTERAYVIEGIRMAKEAPEQDIRGICISESFERSPHPKVWEICERKGYEVLADDVFRKLSDTRTPQGVLMIMSAKEYTPAEVIDPKNNKGQQAPLLVLTEDIQDPGNLGTILRAGEGAGITGAIFSKGTVDIYNPKTIRSTMGSIFRIPFCYVEDLPTEIEKLREQKIEVYAAHLQGSVSYDKKDYTGASAFLIGNEGNGLTDKCTAAASAAVHIPMCGSVESLNAGVAASVLLYEAARQRRTTFSRA